MYVNVAFPLKMPVLTYRAPDSAPPDMAGRIVQAPLMGRNIYGLVMSICGEPEMQIKKKIMEVRNIYQCVMSAPAISFLQWLADYYLTPVGTALRSSFFEEIAAALTKGPESEGPHSRKSGILTADSGQANSTRSRCLRQVLLRTGLAGQTVFDTKSDVALEAICENIRLGEYRSFLCHAGSSVGERSLLIAILTHMKDSVGNAIILAPEIAQLEHIAPLLKDLFGKRVCVLHSKVGRKETAGAISGIIRGTSDIVLGTRSAVLAPLGKVSFIAVLGEHSRSYKAEEGLRYNGRDVAVMRGFHEKASVLLSSICPSVESIYNAGIGKYVFLKTDISNNAERPKIRIVSLTGPNRSESRQPGSPTSRGLAGVGQRTSSGGDRPFLAQDIVKEARNLTALNKRFLFLVSRKGYSLLRCEECGFVERCSKCDVPFIFHKGENILKCHYCGSAQNIPGSCVNCRGTAIKSYGAGTERIKEQVEALLKAEALIVEKGSSALRVFTENSTELAPLVIGTSYARGLAFQESAGERLFGAAAFLNMDALLLQPDFRLYERAFQEVMAVSQMVKEEGTVFLQTRMPQNKTLRFIRAYDFDGFYRYELSQRKAFNNPPFARLVLFTVPVTKEPGAWLTEIQSIAGGVNAGNVEILGPVELPYHTKKYSHCIQVLMKSKERTALHDAARTMMKGLARIKGAKIIVEVDPLKI